MRKVLIAFDGSNFSEGAYEFAKKLNQKESILLTGAFLPQVDYANIWTFADENAAASFIPLIGQEKAEVIEKNKKRFINMCVEDNITCKVHEKFFDFTLPELRRESRFADLVILGSESFYETAGKKGPNEYLTEALHKTECPVVVVPEHFQFPSNNILSYDGSASSVFAIKQFAYLFPEMADNNTLLVTAEDSDSDDLPEETFITEFAKAHFSNLTITTLNIDPKKYFATWIGEKGGSILVTGAYGRSDISQAFKKSFVTDIISAHKVPVFVAHK